MRDGQGKPVENLKKEDSKLFDRAKERSISQFEIETSLRDAADHSLAANLPEDRVTSLDA